MQIIVKRFKKKALKTFKSKKKSHSINNMTKKKNKSHKSKGAFGSKLKIPVIGKIVNNPTFQKVAKASGTVAIAGAIVQLANVPQVNQLWSNQVVRSAVAYSSGDVVGAIGTYVLENPSLLNLGRMNSSNQMSSMVGYA